jgi:hypothetical protein
MDERLKQALDFAKYKETFEIQRKQSREKLDAKLTLGFDGGIFKINQSLITFVQFLLDNGRKNDVPILDSNGNPVLIKDLETFKIEILDRYFAGVLDFYNENERIKKSRSVERLLDL